MDAITSASDLLRLAVTGDLLNSTSRLFGVLQMPLGRRVRAFSDLASRAWLALRYARRHGSA
jgi:hypothetical protein